MQFVTTLLKFSAAFVQWFSVRDVVGIASGQLGIEVVFERIQEERVK